MKYMIVHVPTKQPIVNEYSQPVSVWASDKSWLQDNFYLVESYLRGSTLKRANPMISNPRVDDFILVRYNVKCV